MIDIGGSRNHRNVHWNKLGRIISWSQARENFSQKQLLLHKIYCIPSVEN